MTSGFYATEKGGTVTKVDNDDPRTILEIDGRPAGEVYTEWTEGSLVKGLTYDDDGVATILAPSSFMPLGERIDKNIEAVATCVVTDISTSKARHSVANPM